jgi:hypothetical protein
MFSRLFNAFGRRFQNLAKRESAGALVRANHHVDGADRLADSNGKLQRPACETLAQTREVIDTMLKAMISASGWRTNVRARAEVPVASSAETQE